MAAFTDLCSRRIPNYIIAIALATGVTLAWIRQGFIGTLALSGYCLIVCLMLFPFFAIRLLGAGDVKLYSLLPLFCYKGHILQLYLLVFCVGAVLGICKKIITSDKECRKNHIVDDSESRISWQCTTNAKVLLSQKNAVMALPSGKDRSIGLISFDNTCTIPMAVPFAIGIGIALIVEVSGIYQFF